MISSCILISYIWNTFAFKSDFSIGLSTCLYLILYLSVYRLDPYSTSKCSLCKTYRYCSKYILILSFKYRMRTYYRFNKQVSSGSSVYTRLTLSFHSYGHTVIYTCRNLDLQSFLLTYITVSMAVGTFFLGYLAAAATIRTGLYILHSTEETLLCIHYLALTTALCTSFRCSSRFCTASVTFAAGFLEINTDFFFSSKYSFFKAKAYRGLDIGTLHRSVTCPSSVG